MLAVETVNLSKVYVSTKKSPGILSSLKGLVNPDRKEVVAVKDVNLRIEQGELVGFLGPNGAGKTTTLKMLSGILYPSSGTARVLGFEPFDRKNEMLRQIALVMGNKNQLWWDLPAWDSFIVLRELYEVDQKVFQERLDALIETLQIKEVLHTQVRKMSLGERMKCELVAALLHAPRVMFLDEPTLGLDVVSQKKMREFLREMHRKDGSTILLTSHYMQDVVELCDRVVVIDKGTVVFEGTLDQLTAQFSDTKTVVLTMESEIEASELEKFGTLISQEAGVVVLEVKRSATAEVVSAVLQNLPVVDVKIDELSMEEIIRRLFQGTAQV
ncbi:MAG: ATP-binding cassette domain-containing protein [Fimbriimonadaceae bacterium]